jgi:hypothetical protein
LGNLIRRHRRNVQTGVGEALPGQVKRRRDGEICDAGVLEIK